MFIHSSIGRHLSHFHLLTIMKSPAMNTHVQVFEYLFSILLGHISRTRIGGSNGNSMLNLRTAKLFSTVAAPFRIPIAIYKGSNFSTSSYPLVIFCFIFIIRIPLTLSICCVFQLEYNLCEKESWFCSPQQLYCLKQHLMLGGSIINIP